MFWPKIMRYIDVDALSGNSKVDITQRLNQFRTQ